jgi:Tfp pilus assembly protein PilX
MGFVNPRNPRLKTIVANASRIYRESMTSDRGVALILALMVLAFLTVLGGALLTTTTIDVRIGDNFQTGMTSFYVAETGIEQARELLRTSTSSPTQLLTTAAGTDGIIGTTDDPPLIGGGTIGHYDVWLRNDNADGVNARTDTNDVLTLISIGKMRNSERTVEATVRRPAIDVNDPGLAARIASNAMDIYNPLADTAQIITNYGSPSDYRVALVNGRVDLTGGAGYGILLVRGDLTVTGGVTWNGLIVVESPGVVYWNTTDGLVNGAVFLGQTRMAENWIQYDAQAIAIANKLLPYIPIAVKER